MKVTARKTSNSVAAGQFLNVDEINDLPSNVRDKVLSKIGERHGHYWFRNLCDTLHGVEAREVAAAYAVSDPWVLRVVVTAGRIRADHKPFSPLVSSVIADAEGYIREAMSQGKVARDVVMGVRNALVGWRAFHPEQAKGAA